MAPLAPGKTIVSAVVTEQERDELRRLARNGGRSLSGEVRLALGLYLQHTTYLERTARNNPEEPT
jgi:hypothetical protein